LPWKVEKLEKTLVLELFTASGPPKLNFLVLWGLLVGSRGARSKKKSVLGQFFWGVLEIFEKRFSGVIDDPSS
jgi:hypothetical protein